MNTFMTEAPPTAGPRGWRTILDRTRSLATNLLFSAASNAMGLLAILSTIRHAALEEFDNLSSPLDVLLIAIAVIAFDADTVGSSPVA